jgi:predicted patatin/cPLA2 family phospholipase
MRTALVVEGGAMRGIFSSGVLDAFLQQQFQPFDLAIGCSAGACNLASHLAGQWGRNRLCYTKYMTRPEFINPKRFLRGGHWIDFDWLWESFERDHPLDRSSLAASPVELLMAATSYETGQPIFLAPKPAELMQALKASCALPILYRDAVHVGSQRVMDGGVSAPIPVQEAYRLGARRILVIRSRPPQFVKRMSAVASLSSFAFRDSPSFRRALNRAPQAYRAAVSFIRNPPKDCTILQVAPPRPLATRRTSRDRRALERDYRLGRELGARAIQQWSALTPSSGMLAKQLRRA